MSSFQLTSGVQIFGIDLGYFYLQKEAFQKIDLCSIYEFHCDVSCFSVMVFLCVNPSDVLVVRKVELNCKLKYLCENPIKIRQVIFNVRAVLVSLSSNIISSKTIREPPRHTHIHPHSIRMSLKWVWKGSYSSYFPRWNSKDFLLSYWFSGLTPQVVWVPLFMLLTSDLHTAWKNPVGDCRYDPTGKMKLIKMKELAQMHVRELENKY